MAKNYYEILGVERNASQSDIKSAYRKKAVMLHPDKLKETIDGSRFKELQEAYENLYDPRKRKEYDQKIKSQSNNKPQEPQQPKYNEQQKPSNPKPQEKTYNAHADKVSMEPQEIVRQQWLKENIIDNGKILPSLKYSVGKLTYETIIKLRKFLNQNNIDYIERESKRVGKIFEIVGDEMLEAFTTLQSKTQKKPNDKTSERPESPTQSRKQDDNKVVRDEKWFAEALKKEQEIQDKMLEAEKIGRFRLPKEHEMEILMMLVNMRKNTNLKLKNKKGIGNVNFNVLSQEENAFFRAQMKFNPNKKYSSKENSYSKGR